MISKRSFLFLTTLVFLVLLSACGGGETKPAQTNDSSESDSSSGDVVTVKIAHSELPESMSDEGAQHLADLLEEKSDGRLIGEVYPNGQLGSSTALIEQVQLNSIQVTFQNPSVVSNFIEEAEVVSLPFIWPDEETVFEVMDSEAIDPLKEAAEEQKLKFAGTWGAGFKVMTNNKAPIESPADLKGLDMRVVAGSLPQKVFSAWGANPETIDFSELYNSLQLGVVDGQDNTYEGVHDVKLFEVQDYLTRTNHEYYANLVLIGSEWFDNLTPDLQEVFMDSFEEATEYQREEQTLFDNEREEMVLDKIEINDLSDQQVEKFREKVEHIYQDYQTTDRKKELFENILDGVENKSE